MARITKKQANAELKKLCLKDKLTRKEKERYNELIRILVEPNRGGQPKKFDLEKEDLLKLANEYVETCFDSKFIGFRKAQKFERYTKADGKIGVSKITYDEPSYEEIKVPATKEGFRVFMCKKFGYKNCARDTLYNTIGEYLGASREIQDIFANHNINGTSKSDIHSSIGNRIISSTTDYVEKTETKTEITGAMPIVQIVDDLK